LKHFLEASGIANVHGIELEVAGSLHDIKVSALELRVIEIVQVIHDDNPPSGTEKTLAQVRADEPRSPGHQNTLHNKSSSVGRKQ
jgi:hypothetical protein